MQSLQVVRNRITFLLDRISITKEKIETAVIKVAISIIGRRVKLVDEILDKKIPIHPNYVNNLNLTYERLLNLPRVDKRVVDINFSSLGDYLFIWLLKDFEEGYLLEKAVAESWDEFRDIISGIAEVNLLITDEFREFTLQRLLVKISRAVEKIETDNVQIRGLKPREPDNLIPPSIIKLVEDSLVWKN